MPPDTFEFLFPPIEIETSELSSYFEKTDEGSSQVLDGSFPPAEMVINNSKIKTTIIDINTDINTDCHAVNLLSSHSAVTLKDSPLEFDPFISPSLTLLSPFGADEETHWLNTPVIDDYPWINPQWIPFAADSQPWRGSAPLFIANTVDSVVDIECDLNSIPDYCSLPFPKPCSSQSQNFSKALQNMNVPSDQCVHRERVDSKLFEMESGLVNPPASTPEPVLSWSEAKELHIKQRNSPVMESCIEIFDNFYHPGKNECREMQSLACSKKRPKQRANSYLSLFSFSSANSLDQSTGPIKLFDPCILAFNCFSLNIMTSRLVPRRRWSLGVENIPPTIQRSLSFKDKIAGLLTSKKISKPRFSLDQHFLDGDVMAKEDPWAYYPLDSFSKCKSRQADTFQDIFHRGSLSKLSNFNEQEKPRITRRKSLWGFHLK